MQTQLEKQVWQYMQNDLSKPRPEFNHHAACPYIKKYLNRITVREISRGVKSPIYTACKDLTEHRLMAVVLVFANRNLPHGTIVNACDSVLNLPEFAHCEILAMNHRLNGTVRGVYTGFPHRDLVIVQDRQKLYWARQHLKNTSYYK